MCGSGCVCKEKFPREDQVGYGQRCALRCLGRCDRGDRLPAAGIFLLKIELLSPNTVSFPSTYHYKVIFKAIFHVITEMN